MELILEIEKIAKHIGYTFLLRMDEEDGWFVHFYKHTIDENTGIFRVTDNYFAVYTNALEDSLDYLVHKIKSDFCIEGSDA